ncbi:hypothetical protein BKA65DRAFT_256073 [Rhexocercosporidium sp. MPI-PUGE-AT-0058]|nr:hypothetical protein BKA65DRAFT_256073 [Rhexocercosporidium sp. MPI-PUGE-AT-0058]
MLVLLFSCVTACLAFRFMRLSRRRYQNFFFHNTPNDRYIKKCNTFLWAFSMRLGLRLRLVWLGGCEGWVRCFRYQNLAYSCVFCFAIWVGWGCGLFIFFTSLVDRRGRMMKWMDG